MEQIGQNVLLVETGNGAQFADRSADASAPEEVPPWLLLHPAALYNDENEGG